jgi:hypothetical protein
MIEHCCFEGVRIWRSLAPLALTASLLTPAVAQTWATVGTPQPSVSFGTENQLLARDSSGLVGFDETLGRTLLSTATGWVSLPSAISPRVSATICSNGSRVYLFGGLDGTTGLVDQVWRFERNTQDWTPMNTLSAPSPRYRAVAAQLGSSNLMLLFGGTDATGVRNDTWLFADASIMLMGPQTTPVGLIPRTGMALAGGPEQSAVLFGGQATTTLGDTWIFRGTTWTQYQGSGPPPAADCRMVYDHKRDVTVLLHPNGETWEWNDYDWRRTPATGGPGSWNRPAVSYVPLPGVGLRALVDTAAGLTTWAFTPSLADFELTQDATCFNGNTPLELGAFRRSLPHIGQNFQLRATGALPSTLCVGAYELSTSTMIPWTCGCMIGLFGVGTGLQFVPGTTSERNWSLPIAPSPLLNGVAIDVQAFFVDPALPCLIMTTQRGKLTAGF